MEFDEFQETDIECLTYTVAGPSTSRTENKLAWKNLMGKMQENQTKSSREIPNKSSTKDNKNTPTKSKTSTPKTSQPEIKQSKSKDETHNNDRTISNLLTYEKQENDLTYPNSQFTHAKRKFSADVYIPFGTIDDGEQDDEVQIVKRAKIDYNGRFRYFLKSVENVILPKPKDTETSALTPKRRVARPDANASASELRKRANSIIPVVMRHPSQPERLFSIFTSLQVPSKSKVEVIQANFATCDHTSQSQYNFNHVIYDYPEIQDGWEAPEKEEILVNDNKKEDSSAGAEASNATNSKQKSTKNCPFYKKIPGTNFAVDAFTYGKIPEIDFYFLSHFHSDHYMGLTKKFNSTIVCSRPTGNLVNMKLGVTEDRIRKLELNKIYLIQGTEVVLLEANHCPGSVMFIFRLKNGSTIFHTGDFRYTPDILTSPFVRSLGKVSCVYLDTTYCDPKYDFPSQSDAVNQVITTVKKHLGFRPKTLIACGAYSIGKERVFFSLAEAINTKVFCAFDKYKMLSALGNSAFQDCMKNQEDGCQIHVLPMKDLNASFLSTYLEKRSSQFTNILAIKPSGWEFKSAGQGFSKRSYLNDTVSIIGVPYSEHSSFSELQDFIKALKPSKVQPTVNVGNETKRNQMVTFIEEWLLEAGCTNLLV